MRSYALLFDAEKERHSIIFRDDTDAPYRWYLFIREISPEAAETTVLALNQDSLAKEKS